MSWHLWGILAVAAIVFEIVSPTFFMWFVGLGFILSAVVSYLDGSLTIQVILAILGMFVGVYYFKKSKLNNEDKYLNIRQSDDIESIRGVAKSNFSEQEYGSVMLNTPYLGESFWRAKSQSGAIEEGMSVKVISISGNTIIVAMESK